MEVSWNVLQVVKVSECTSGAEHFTERKVSVPGSSDVAIPNPKSTSFEFLNLVSLVLRSFPGER